LSRDAAMLTRWIKLNPAQQQAFFSLRQIPYSYPVIEFATLIMASVMLDNLVADQSPDVILLLYPMLHREDVTAVMAYAAELAREPVVPTSA
jgi:uncharacterized protein (DUF433 family)